MKKQADFLLDYIFRNVKNLDSSKLVYTFVVY